MVLLTSKRECWWGTRTIPEDASGYDWVPYQAIYRVWYWRGIRVWSKLLARRDRDQYWLVHRAFGNAAGGWAK